MKWLDIAQILQTPTTLVIHIGYGHVWQAFIYLSSNLLTLFLVKFLIPLLHAFHVKCCQRHLDDYHICTNTNRVKCHISQVKCFPSVLCRSGKYYSLKHFSFCQTFYPQDVSLNGLVFISGQFRIVPTETEFRQNKNNPTFISLSLERAFVMQDDPQAMQCYYLNVFLL